MISFTSLLNRGKSKFKNSEGHQIAKLYYLMSYKKHYAELLQLFNPYWPYTKMGELFLYRQWVIQFLYRICAPEQVGEKTLQDILNEGSTIGQRLLKQLEGVDMVYCFGDTYMNTLNQRWSKYEEAVINNHLNDQVPYKAVLDTLIDYITKGYEPHIKTQAFALLSADLLDLQDQVKKIIFDHHYSGKMPFTINANIIKNRA
ncbi:hypothetical protein [Flavisolibacter tropicus]|uniref:Uncharacterized protein n=1 Tax=Flavisolibacter tropicus TaxID=1492898 RepID=A0A172TZX6_9BACT|nr:hypothetical protein [Flavisolibacter tropicus]ANE52655.1 hypothetical protein SY85_21405 [Flavisolibacter tropicus]